MKRAPGPTVGLGSSPLAVSAGRGLGKSSTEASRDGLADCAALPGRRGALESGSDDDGSSDGHSVVSATETGDATSPSFFYHAEERGAHRLPARQRPVWTAVPEAASDPELLAPGVAAAFAGLATSDFGGRSRGASPLESPPAHQERPTLSKAARSLADVGARGADDHHGWQQQWQQQWQQPSQLSSRLPTQLSSQLSSHHHTARHAAPAESTLGAGAEPADLQPEGTSAAASVRGAAAAVQSGPGSSFRPARDILFCSAGRGFFAGYPVSTRGKYFPPLR